MQDLSKVYLKPLINGNFILNAVTEQGTVIERELRFIEIKSYLLTQDSLTINFKRGERYNIALSALDFSKLWTPLYILGYRVGASYFHILYALAAEVSYYTSGYADWIDRDFLRDSTEFGDFWRNQNMEKMLQTLLKTAQTQKGE